MRITLRIIIFLLASTIILLAYRMYSLEKINQALEHQILEFTTNADASTASHGYTCLMWYKTTDRPDMGYDRESDHPPTVILPPSGYYENYSIRKMDKSISAPKAACICNNGYLDSQDAFSCLSSGDKGLVCGHFDSNQENSCGPKKNEPCGGGGPAADCSQYKSDSAAYNACINPPIDPNRPKFNIHNNAYDAGGIIIGGSGPGSKGAMDDGGLGNGTVCDNNGICKQRDLSSPPNTSRPPFFFMHPIK